MTVTAFAGQVELEAAVFAGGLVVAGEGHALIDQPFNRFAAMFHGEAHRFFAAQAGTGIESVLDMRLDGICVVQHRCHATLGPVRRAIGQIALAQHGNAQVLGQGQRQRQASGPAADDQNVVLVVLAHVVIPQVSGPWEAVREQTNLLRKSRIGHFSRYFSVNRATVPLEIAQKPPQPGLPSLRSLFSGSLLVYRAGGQHNSRLMTYCGSGELS
ncbi:hypothetical protein D3C84_275860 [compost metagenome]